MSRKKTPISGRCFPFFFHLDAGQTETRDGEAYASLRHVSDVSEATYPSVSSERRDEERVSHTREQWHPTSHTGTGDPPTAAEMSLLPEGFKTRIPRPAVAASPAPVAEEAPPAARATAAAVKSAVAAAVRPISPTVSIRRCHPPPISKKPKQTPPDARARSHPLTPTRPVYPLNPTSRAARARRMLPLTTPRRAPSASPWRPPSPPTRHPRPKSQTAVTHPPPWISTPSTRNSSP